MEEVQLRITKLAIEASPYDGRLFNRTNLSSLSGKCF
jgi:hypothetical protein